MLLVGVDKLPNRTATLTDTMMVASLDPVGKTVSRCCPYRATWSTRRSATATSSARSSTRCSATRTRTSDQFPKGGIRTLEDAIGALLGIPIHYYARIDFVGFIDMVDAVGGVDVTVAKGFQDPGYDGFGFGKRGWSITAGPHHLDGPNALAFARSRKAAGESDFTRAARQQQILVALRDKVTSGGNLLFQLPGLLDAVGRTIRSDVPVDKLPALAAIMEEISQRNVVSAVIRFPLVHPKSTRYGDSQEPDLAAIRAVAADLFPAPGRHPRAGRRRSRPAPRPRTVRRAVACASDRSEAPSCRSGPGAPRGRRRPGAGADAAPR